MRAGTRPRLWSAACVLAVGLAACGQRIVLGSSETITEPPATGGGGGSPPEPPETISCKGQPCGATCTELFCNEGACAALQGICDALGTCQLDWTDCGEWPPPCAGLLCGEPCSPCPPWDTGCQEAAPPSFCDAFGACSPEPVECKPPYDPCAHAGDFPCGTPCWPCDPADPFCLPPNEPFFCDMNWWCVPFWEVQCPPWPECEGLVCGERCYACEPPDDPACDTLPLCDMFGQCARSDVVCW